MKTKEKYELEKLVNSFACEMKKRLIQKMEAGYLGWRTMPPEFLQSGLKENSISEDWIDVANFAAFLWYQNQT